MMHSPSVPRAAGCCATEVLAQARRCAVEITNLHNSMMSVNPAQDTLARSVLLDATDRLLQAVATFEERAYQVAGAPLAGDTNGAAFTRAAHEHLSEIRERMRCGVAFPLLGLTMHELGRSTYELSEGCSANAVMVAASIRSWQFSQWFQNRLLELGVDPESVALQAGVGAVCAWKQKLPMDRWWGYYPSVDELGVLATLDDEELKALALAQRSPRWFGSNEYEQLAVLQLLGVLAPMDAAARETFTTLLRGWGNSVGDLVLAAETLSRTPATPRPPRTAQ